MAQIFIAHSSRDKLLIDWIAENLRTIGINPYVSEYDSPSPRALDEKFRTEISRSQAMFLILTRNLTRRKKTSEIVHWEVAKAQEKKIPVYVWKEKGAKVPLMITLTEDYGTFDPVSRTSLVEAMNKMLSVGKKLKTQEEENRTLMAKGFAKIAEAVFTILGSNYL